MNADSVVAVLTTWDEDKSRPIVPREQKHISARVRIKRLILAAAASA